MLDHFVILSKGGLVLWETKDGHEVTRDAVNNVIAAVILEVNYSRCSHHSAHSESAFFRSVQVITHFKTPNIM
jgi:hypothetical protein